MTQTISNQLNDQQLQRGKELTEKLTTGLNQVLLGKEELVELVTVGVVSQGHILLEGLPGLGKTELVKGLSTLTGLETSRVQFTPDLLPGDITGNPILQEVEGRKEFVFQQGPVFTNLLLADEINRASPKTQSALLEAMQEKQVTVLGETHFLPSPFFVLATQNPIEQEGTYSLPEAQLDRFLFKLLVKPNSAETLEQIIFSKETGKRAEVKSVMTPAELQELLDMVDEVYLPDTVVNFIARIVDATNLDETDAGKKIQFGASPRAALSFARAAKAKALMVGRPNASFEDVRDLALPILRHRIILDYQAKIAGETADTVIEKLLEEVPATPKFLPPGVTAV